MKRVLALLIGLGFCGFLMTYGITQEVPLGQVKGEVSMAENQKPLEDALVTFTPLQEIDKEIIRPRYVYSKSDGSFAVRNMPAGAYEMEVSAQHHSLGRRFLWVEEGKATELGKLALKPSDPYLNLYASQRVFTPEETPQIELHGFMENGAVNLDILKMDVGGIARKGGLREAMSPLTENPRVDPGIASVVQSGDYPITKRDAEGAFIEHVKIPKLDEGFYLIRVSSDKLKAATYLNITRIAMVTKTAKGESLGFVTDLVSGQPIAGADLAVALKGKLEPAGKTDNNGLGTIRYDIQGDQSLVMARKGKSVAFVGFWTGNRTNSNVRIYTYTDRPIYRPGDEISFKGVIRKIEDNNLSLPAQSEITVNLRNNDGEVVQTQKLPVSSHGTYHGTFKTANEAEPGEWAINTQAYGADENKWFGVAAYRKPEYSVVVTPDKPYYILGQRAKAKVKCEYYYGGPVIGAKVQAYVYRAPDWGYGESEDGEDWGRSEFDGGEFAEEIEAVTDANGEAVIEFETRAEGDPEKYPTDFTYSVMASVADAGDKRFDGEGSVKVVRGAFELSAETNRYVVAQGDSYEVAFKAVGHDGKPVANKPIDVVVGREEWTSRTTFTVPLETKTITTDSEGKATLSVTAGKPGSIDVTGTAKDEAGNGIAASANVWIDGSGAQLEPDSGDFRITPDRKQYMPGDAAKVLLLTSKPGGSVLLTVEAERVMWQKVVPLTEKSTLVELTIDRDFAPNAYVTAAYVRDKQFFTDSKRIKIARPDRLLNVSVSPSKPAYQPGEMAELTIQTKDDQGKPAPAEVSVGVVDESIYAIRRDGTDIVEGLYPRRYNQVDTAYSFPEIYLDGGDKGGNVPLRTKFKDTAWWAPAVETDSQGRAVVRFQLPDNLTEWRATVVGVTDQTVAGMSKTSFKARKDLMVRMTPPMYLVKNDFQRMAVIVTNDTGKDAEVNVRVEAAGIALDGQTQRTIRVAAGRPEAIDFTLQAIDAGEATLTARAWITGGASDGVQQKLAVHAYGRRVVEDKAGSTSSAATETLTVSPGADPNTGQLTITAAPSLADGLMETLPSLIDYPYGCVEQTMSKFMPSVVVAGTFRDFGMKLPEVAKKLPAIAADSYARLGKMQHGDGGWGWWEYDSSSPFMTALVLDGIDRAKEAGYPPHDVDIKKAVARAVQVIRQAPTERYLRGEWERDRTYLAYVLTRYGQKPAAEAALKNFSTKSAGPSELAFAALTAHALGATAQRDAYVQKLVDLAQEGSTVASWAPQGYAWGQEPTALALNAISTIYPDHPLVPKVVRYLMLAKKPDGWTSTRDTTYSVVALTGYLAQHRDQLNSHPTVRVSVNGVEQPVVPSKGLSIPMKSLRKGANEVRIEAAGGTAFYTARLEQFDTQADMGPQPGKGLTIERSYHLLEPQRIENGSTQLLPSKRQIDQVKSGDLVRVVLTIKSDLPRQYVMVEDPLPSNFRAMEREDVGSDEWGWWWSKTVLRDDRITFFSTWMDKGTQTIEYTIRAESPGTGNALPTRIENMYDPTQFATGAAKKLEVTR